MNRRQFLSLSKFLTASIVLPCFGPVRVSQAAFRPKIRLKGKNLSAEKRVEGKNQENIKFKVEADSPFIQELEKVINGGYWRHTFDSWAPDIRIVEDPQNLGSFIIDLYPDWILVNYELGQKFRKITADDYNRLYNELIKHQVS